MYPFQDQTYSDVIFIEFIINPLTKVFYLPKVSSPTPTVSVLYNTDQKTMAYHLFL